MESPPEPVRPWSILLVDDVPEIGDAFAAILRRVHGRKIALRKETSSARAIATIERETFDLILSDYRMPGPDGVDVLKAARRARPDAARVLMTGYNEIPTSWDRVESAEVDAIVRKPLDDYEVLLLVMDFMNGNRQAIKEHRKRARSPSVLRAEDADTEAPAG